MPSWPLGISVWSLKKRSVVITEFGVSSAITHLTISTEHLLFPSRCWEEINP